MTDNPKHTPECNCGMPGPGTNAYHDSDCPVSLLRAAAPDLLAALKLALAWADAQDVNATEPWQEWAFDARAAIAKAEGGAA
jgi:hypothetical protein